MTATPKLPSDTVPHEPRTYRNRLRPTGLVRFRVGVKETDLLVYADSELKAACREMVLRYRRQLETFIAVRPEFAATRLPWPETDSPAPALVRDMIAAAENAGVGPMAAVAGAIAEAVGRDLLAYSARVVIENGGDLFLKTDEPVVIGIYAADSPLSFRVGLRVDTRQAPLGVCTSSGTVGHSLSRGRADAVCVVSTSCAAADAAATAIGNRVRSAPDIPAAVAFGRNITSVKGLVIIIGDRLGLWGDLEVVPLKGKKG